MLLLGGTGEARRLAALLTADGVEVLSSLAGRTADPLLPDGAVRVGGPAGQAGQHVDPVGGQQGGQPAGLARPTEQQHLSAHDAPPCTMDR